MDAYVCRVGRGYSENAFVDAFYPDTRDVNDVFRAFAGRIEF